MKSLFDTEGYTEIRNRLQNFSEDADRQWGKMTSGQMAHHCQGPLNVIMEKEDYGLKPNWFAKTFFKKAMFSDKPWRKNLPTIPKFRETEPRDFAREKANLEALLDEFNTHRDRNDWQEHPTFGSFTKAQWGKMQYKHLDHHLRQFNA